MGGVGLSGSVSPPVLAAEWNLVAACQFSVPPLASNDFGFVAWIVLFLFCIKKHILFMVST